MIQKDSFSILSSGGAPDWSPCGDCAAVVEGELGKVFSPEFLASANAFVLNNE